MKLTKNWNRKLLSSKRISIVFYLEFPSSSLQSGHISGSNFHFKFFEIWFLFDAIQILNEYKFSFVRLQGKSLSSRFGIDIDLVSRFQQLIIAFAIALLSTRAHTQQGWSNHLIKYFFFMLQRNQWWCIHIANSNLKYIEVNEENTWAIASYLHLFVISTGSILMTLLWFLVIIGDIIIWMSRITDIRTTLD